MSVSEATIWIVVSCISASKIPATSTECQACSLGRSLTSFLGHASAGGDSSSFLHLVYNGSRGGLFDRCTGGNNRLIVGGLLDHILFDEGLLGSRNCFLLIFFLDLRPDDVLRSLRLDISIVEVYLIVGSVGIEATAADTASGPGSSTVLVADVVVTALVPVAAITISISEATDVDAGAVFEVIDTTVKGGIVVSDISSLAPVVFSRIAKSMWVATIAML